MTFQIVRPGIVERARADEEMLSKRRAELEAAGASPRGVDRLFQRRLESGLFGDNLAELVVRANELEASARAGRRSLLRGAGFGELHLRCTWDRAPDLTAAVAVMRAWKAQPLPFLALAGPPGTGKTTAATAAAGELVEGIDDDVAERHGLSVRLVRAADLSRLAGYEHAAEWAKLTNSRLLVVDDLGADFVDGRGWSASALDKLIDVRYAAAALTIFTTNLDAASLADRVGPRVFDRMVELAVFENVVGPSLRRGAP